MEVIIKQVPATRAISLRSLLPTYRAQKALWIKLWTFASLNQLSCVGHCVTIYHKILDDSNSMADVQVCIPIGDEAKVPTDEEITLCTLPSIERAARTIHQGSFDNIGPVYQALHAWIQAHDEKESGPNREVCLSADENDSTEASYITEIQVPLA